MNTNKSNNEAVTDTVSMSDSARSKDLAALERRSFNMSAQGEPIDETKVKEPQPSTSEQQTEPPPAGSDIPLMRLFGKIEAIYGIAKLPNESVLNALLTTEKIKSSGCFLALVLNQIQLTLKEERIDLQTTDVIVNSTKPNLKIKGFGLFNAATVSRAIAKAAGPDALLDLKKNYKDGIGFGELAIGNPGNLQCLRLFHVAIEHYGGARNGAKTETLKRVVNTCLVRAEQMGYTSITFPAIGTGKMGYPPTVVAEAMLDCFVNYAKTQTDTSVKNIVVVTGVGCGGAVHEDHKMVYVKRGHFDETMQMCRLARIFPVAYIGNKAFKQEEIRRTVSLLKEGHHILVDPQAFCPAYLHITAHSQDRDKLNAIVTELSGKL